jgi:hypothetical protein
MIAPLSEDAIGPDMLPGFIVRVEVERSVVNDR